MVFLMISKNHILDVLTLLLVSSGTTVLSQLINQNSYLNNFHKVNVHSSLMLLQFPRLLVKRCKNSQLNNYVIFGTGFCYTPWRNTFKINETESYKNQKQKIQLNYLKTPNRRPGLYCLSISNFHVKKVYALPIDRVFSYFLCCCCCCCSFFQPHVYAKPHQNTFLEA